MGVPSCLTPVKVKPMVVFSIFLRCFKRPYMRISLEGHPHEFIPTESIVQNEDEEDDWLERALIRDQFNQSQKLQQ
ncbi:Protein of unknown function [Gryllus bimaculatus]|nr:Protein of unknown function [Gryllus bimaculatus]